MNSFLSLNFPTSGDSNSGVYALSGVNTPSCYVGSSTNLLRREKEQFSALEHDRHYNRNLQEAFAELGREGMRFVLLESVARPEELAAKEQEWIYRMGEKGSLYNLYLVVPKKRPGGHKLSRETRLRQSRAKRGARHPGFGKRVPVEKTRARRYRFQAPDGTIVETLGLRALAEKHGLNVSHLSKVSRGKLREHRGFKRAGHANIRRTSLSKIAHAENGA